jgi:GH24 family phage-related lysozyme (muramidase)
MLLLLSMADTSKAFWRGMTKAAADVAVPPAAQTNVMDLLKYFEGFSPKSYKDPAGQHNAVGYGFNLSPGNRSIWDRLFGGKPNFDRVNQGVERITPQQGDQLLAQKMLSVSNTAQKAFPDLPKYNPQLQGAIINGYYRGDLPGSPKALNMLQKSNYTGAAQEYLNNNEFKTTPLQGVKNRMQYNANVFAKQQPAIASK